MSVKGPKPDLILIFLKSLPLTFVDINFRPQLYIKLGGCSLKTIFIRINRWVFVEGRQKYYDKKWRKMINKWMIQNPSGIIPGWSRDLKNIKKHPKQSFSITQRLRKKLKKSSQNSSVWWGLGPKILKISMLAHVLPAAGLSAETLTRFEPRVATHAPAWKICASD